MRVSTHARARTHTRRRVCRRVTTAVRSLQMPASRDTQPYSRRSAPPSPVALSLVEFHAAPCSSGRGLYVARMASMSTRASSKRTRSDLSKNTEECPVCMVQYQSNGSNVFAFPCGHCVCSGCDEKLQERSFFSCPTCREPRAGVSRAQVDAAATARVQRDQLSDQHSQEPWQLRSMEHNGHHYSVLFLRDESDGAHPFDVLRTVQGQAAIGRVTHNSSGQPVIDLTGDDENPNPNLRVRVVRRGEVALPAPLAAMVREMLQPTNLPEWLRRHDALASIATNHSRRDQPL